MNKCIILANGKPPRKGVITFFQRNGYSKLICADGGANSALKMGLIPDVIIGDLDSIETLTIHKLLMEKVASIGENIIIRRFTRWERREHKMNPEAWAFGVSTQPKANFFSCRIGILRVTLAREIPISF